MDDKRAMLLHFLAALAYRSQKALREAPPSFGAFEAGNQVRNPKWLVQHMDSVLGYALTRFEGEAETYRNAPLATLDDEVLRFHGKLEDLGRHLRAGSALRGTTPEQLLQGPFADAMTHAGQLAMLRRLAGAPIAPENFIVAEISPDNLGPDQPPPKSPDAVWPERPVAGRDQDGNPRTRRAVTPGMRFTIDLARPHDLPELPAIELAAARELEGHAPEAVLAESTPLEDLAAAQSDGRLWVALADDRPVGFAIVELLPDGLPHLDEVDVHPDFGGIGFGTALVRAVCDWTAQNRFAEITLTTFRAVPWNMPFYARMGFELVPEAVMRPALQAVVDDETARGLDPATRCVMRYRAAPARPGRRRS